MSHTLKSKIEIVNNKLSEITGKDHVMMADIVIDFNEIVAIREQAHDDSSEISPDMCTVYLRSGEFFYLYTPYLEVASRLGWL